MLSLVASPANHLRVLTYHRVADPKQSLTLDPRLISADPQMFQKQMHYLTKHYQVVSLETVLNTLERGTNLPKNAVLITFDDAYADLNEHALPIIQSMRLPATIFVPTAYPDHPERSFWWDRIYRAFLMTERDKFYTESLGALPIKTNEECQQSVRQIKKRLRTLPALEAENFVDEICDQLQSKVLVQKSVMSWQELRQLAKAGITIGAHTRTHPYLICLSATEAKEEIVGSQADLQREIGEVLPVFCYPNGDHNDAIVNLLKQANFKLAFTTLSGQNELNNADLLRLNRQNLTRKTTLPVFQLRLLRIGGHLDRWRLRQERQYAQ